MFAAPSEAVIVWKPFPAAVSPAWSVGISFKEHCVIFFHCVAVIISHLSSAVVRL